MGLTRQQKESVCGLAGRELSAQVESVVFGRAPCICPRCPALNNEGHCITCSGSPVACWADSENAIKYLRGHISTWAPFYRDRFCDHLGQCISRRMAEAQGGGGAIQPRLWVLFATPADICRAAILAKMES